TGVKRICVEVQLGQMVGLIGPNGAGKTTTFNACSGLVKAAAGSVTLFGRDVTKKSACARARLGLGRTFQLMELYDRLTVRQNVAMGLEARLAGERLLGTILSTTAEARAGEQATERALERCGIFNLRSRGAG